MSFYPSIVVMFISGFRFFLKLLHSLMEPVTLHVWEENYWVIWYIRNHKFLIKVGYEDELSILVLENFIFSLSHIKLLFIYLVGHLHFHQHW